MQELEAIKSELLDSIDSTTAAQDLRNRRESELQDMKKQLEVGGKTHEQTIQDLRHKHNSAIEQLNEQLDNVKKVGNRSVPNPIPNSSAHSVSPRLNHSSFFSLMK